VTERGYVWVRVHNPVVGSAPVIVTSLFMCGIVGIVQNDFSRPVEKKSLNDMIESLRHRGPDDSGSVVVQGVGLGMRRLSIIDVEGGQQPFTTEDGAVHLVANGEIYNFKELRAELISAGHQFRSHSDIEVLVHAYEEWNESFLQRVQGMFALALWDRRNETLICARDRAGEKPLYYTRTADAFLLASELKALFVRSDVGREIDMEALDQFLTYEYVMAPRTILQGIHKLPPAHYLRYRKGDVSVKRYWSANQIQVQSWNDKNAATAVRETLGRAVSRQMMSDVPFGAFLSGGIDSSAIVALMAQEAHKNNVGINTFSMGFKDGSYNELAYAREVADILGTNHREGIVDPRIGDLFHKLISHLDEPFADVSLFPTYLVSQSAREHVKVVLSGDGGDELFGGYDTYEADRMARGLALRVPKGALSALANLTSMVPPSSKKKGLINKLKRFMSGLVEGPDDLQHYRWMTFLSAARKRELYSTDFQDRLRNSDVYKPVRECLGSMETDDLLNRQLYTDLSLYLADDILVKVDRMSMATSLETRAPFLDVEVMELAFSMPGHLKLRGRQRKYVLKKAFEDVLPSSVLTRPKEGFSIPMKNWLRSELAPLMDELLSSEQIIRRGWFEPDVVQRAVTAHKDGRQNNAHLLFSLMVLERWAQEYIDGV